MDEAKKETRGSRRRGRTMESQSSQAGLPTPTVKESAGEAAQQSYGSPEAMLATHIPRVHAPAGPQVSPAYTDNMSQHSIHESDNPGTKELYGYSSQVSEQTDLGSVAEDKAAKEDTGLNDETK